jgi:hypothetical protein
MNIFWLSRFSLPLQSCLWYGGCISEHVQYVDINCTLGRMLDEWRSQLILTLSDQYLMYAHDIEYLPVLR